MIWDLQTIHKRWLRSLILVLGFFAVALVFLAVFSVRAGLDRVVSSTGSNDIAIVSANDGLLDGNALQVIGQAPGVAHGPSGPLIMGVFLTTAQLPTVSSGLLGAASFRGVGENMRDVWSNFRILKGRMFQTGVNEVIVGYRAERLFHNLAIGDSINWNNRQWKIVGVFSDGQSIHNSEIWTSATQLQGAYNANGRYVNAFVKLISPGQYAEFARFVEVSPQLNVSVVRSDVGYRQGFQGLDKLIANLGGVITLLMAVAAIFGAINIMNSNITSRVRDIATFLALGFMRFAVLNAIILDGVLLSLIGGLIACLSVYFIFNGYEASTFGNSALVSFNFAVTPRLMSLSLMLAIVMGFVGSTVPAIRIASMSVARVLREV